MTPEEATADMRTAARAMRDMYVALVNEGFKPMEALVIIGHVIAAGMNKGND